MNSPRLWVSLLVVGLIAGLCVTAVAQDDPQSQPGTNVAPAPVQPQPQPAPQVQPQTKPAEPKVDKTPSPAETAKEAAEGALGAWKNREFKKLTSYMPVDERKSFTEDGKAFFAALKVKSYEVGKVTEKDDAGKAEYTWEVTFNPDVLFKDELDKQRQELLKSGLSKDMVDQQMKMIEGFMAAAKEQLKKQFEVKKHRMVLSKVDGRWYVADLFGDESDEKPDGDDNPGGANNPGGDDPATPPDGSGGSLDDGGK